MSSVDEDLHAQPLEQFREQVHSFEFWFGAVRGYLDGCEYGRPPQTPSPPLPASEADRLVTILCSYCVGETIALEGASGLIRSAPNRATKIFLSTQTVDEGRHLEVLIHRLRELGVADAEREIERRAHPSLVTFKREVLALVVAGDWLSALFAQNVILEAMEFAVFHRHAARADPATREVLLRIVKDERRHIGFGENEVGRGLQHAPGARRRLAEVRARLDPLVLESFAQTLREVGAPAAESADLGREYLRAVERLGFA
jgi:1,2-phenylacetyl-CoA epoxidase catalytic subunit